VANLLMMIFNACFLARYILYLGFPVAIAKTTFNVMDSAHVSRADFNIDWPKWARVHDVSTGALVSNCISTMIFYLDWYNAIVDSDRRFNMLTIPVKALVRPLTTDCFELLIMLSLIVSYIIDMIDGMLFFVLTASLMMVSIFHESPKANMLQIMSIVTDCAAPRLAHPVFADTGARAGVVQSAIPDVAGDRVLVDHHEQARAAEHPHHASEQRRGGSASCAPAGGDRPRDHEEEARAAARPDPDAAFAESRRGARAAALLRRALPDRAGRRVPLPRRAARAHIGKRKQRIRNARVIDACASGLWRARCPLSL
jgi:hypothetical protein